MWSELWRSGDWHADGRPVVTQYATGLGSSRFKYAPACGEALKIATDASHDALRSHREFNPTPLSASELTKLLGVLCEAPEGMPYGSAGALYPVHTFAFRPADREAEVWYLDNAAFEVIPVGAIDSRSVSAALIDKWAWPVGALMVLTLDFRRVCEKYGARGLRFATIEAGEVAQLIRERARDMGLRSCIVGGFGDEELLRALSLDERWYGVAIAIAVGRSAEM